MIPQISCWLAGEWGCTWGSQRLRDGEDLLLPRIRKELCRGVLPHFSEGLQLVCSSLGADIGLSWGGFVSIP